jgi:hypothetical protein
MRRLLFMLFALVTLSATAQKKDTVKPEAVRPITDTTALVQLKDYDEFVKQVVQELPAKYADVIRQWWIDRIRQRIQEYQKSK